MYTKERPGKVKAPEPDTYLFEQLFRKKAQEKFVGTDGALSALKSEEGKGKIAEARAETESALGYSLKEAEEESMIMRLHDDLQYSKPDKSGKEEMHATEVSL